MATCCSLLEAGLVEDNLAQQKAICALGTMERAAKGPRSRGTSFGREWPTSNKKLASKKLASNKCSPERSTKEFLQS